MVSVTERARTAGRSPVLKRVPVVPPLVFSLMMKTPRMLADVVAVNTA